MTITDSQLIISLMIKPSVPSWLNWLRWDLRTILAVLLGLGLVITFTIAAPDATAVTTFDFGTASSTDIEAGAIGVMGGGSVYPKASGNFTYGWDSSLIQAISRGSAVADKLNRDYNFSPGGSSAIFKISGFSAGNYNLRFYVGDNTTKVATQIKVQGRTTTIIRTSSYGTADLPISVASSAEVVDIEMSSAATDASWVINAIRVFNSSTTAPDPSFTMTVSPATQTIRPGGTAVYLVGISPVNNYGADVDLSVSGLVAGITATIIPPQVTDLPNTAQLRLSTEDSVSALPYEFLLRGRGTDAAATTKNMVVKLVVSQSAPITPDDNNPDGGTVIQPTSQVPGESQSAAEQKAQFNLIDDYVAAEARRLITKNNVGELDKIGDEFTAFPIAPDMPPTKSLAERSLQFLTRVGIIGVVVDNAPRGEEDSGPKSLWRRILDGIAAPLGG
jgi:hypothetical protein